MSKTSATPEKEIIYVQPSLYETGCDDDEIDLLELWRVIWQGKWFIAAFTFCVTLVAVFVVLFYLPTVYKTNATLIPAQQEKSALGGLGGLLGSLPISLPGQGTNNIMSFLESRTLRERLISKYDLLPILYSKMWDAENKSWLVENADAAPTLIKALQGGLLNSFLSVSQDKKTQLINLSWSSEDPAFCQLMINRVIGELTFFLEHEYVSSAKNEKEFVKERLAMVTGDLEYWESQVPDKDMTLSKITRERLASQAVYTELRKQLELAKITEAKELESFKVLDKPFTPEKPFKPKKRIIVVLTFLSSGMFAVLLVFFRNFLQNLQKNEVLSKKEE